MNGLTADEAVLSDQLESVTLVDASDNAIGACGKLAAHREGRLHRAFSILISNCKGELLLQQRASGKYHFAGRWSNSCCGHPRPGEPTVEAARRRLAEEFGFSARLASVGAFQYRAEDPVSGLVEHEYLHVLCGRFDGVPMPNPDEVGSYRWAHPVQIRRSLQRRPELFTPWFALLANEQLTQQ